MFIKIFACLVFFFFSFSLEAFNNRFFLRKIQQDPPKWMVEQIAKDLSAYKDSGISAESIDTAFQFFENDPFILKCSIRNHSIKFEITTKKLTLKQYREILDPGYCKRYLTIRNILFYLTKKRLLPDLDFVISLRDGLQNSTPGPVFTFAKNKNKASLIAFPDFEIIQGYGQLNKIIRKASLDFPYETKKDLAFWRGATTGGVYSPTNWMNFPRTSATLLSREYPDQIDAKFTFITDWIKELTSIFNEKGILSEKVSVYDHLRYKFLLDIDGHSCTYSRLYWLLLSNSVCLKQVTDNEQWYYGALKPYTHYIPLESDLSDLKDKIAWAIQNPGKCKMIANTGTKFAREHLQKEDVYLYVYLLLNEYAKLQKF
ncbi:MAG: hypothetical protein S4CHLAM37_16090 [Chlamydiia bacterium]|nr:hypothetical protein [Chlamydiia bacterium]